MWTQSIAFLIVKLSLFAIGNCSWRSSWANVLGFLHAFLSCRKCWTAARLDVVHITTPPQSHYSLAKQCLESGSHVYLEKPFTITAGEAESLIRLAERRDLKITAGHNLQFTPETLEMRQLLAQGFLGGKPVHLESHFSYDLGDTTYVERATW